MTELFTTFAVLAPLAFTFAVAAHCPRDAAGKVTRGRRTFAKDVRSFFHLAAY